MLFISWNIWKTRSAVGLAYIRYYNILLLLAVLFALAFVLAVLAVGFVASSLALSTFFAICSTTCLLLGILVTAVSLLLSLFLATVFLFSLLVAALFLCLGLVISLGVYCCR